MVSAEFQLTYEVVNMLGARIAALRREKGMNQAQLASKLKISPSTVGMYEQGRREPSAEMLLSMARTLGVTVDYLLSGEPDKRDVQALNRILSNKIEAADRKLSQRRDRPFSREELAVLFAAMLIDPE